MPLTCLCGLTVKSDKLHWKIWEDTVYKDSLHPKIFHEQAVGILVLLDSETVICLKQTPVLAARNWARTRPFYNIISIPQKWIIRTVRIKWWCSTKAKKGVRKLTYDNPPENNTKAKSARWFINKNLKVLFPVFVYSGLLWFAYLY